MILTKPSRRMFLGSLASAGLVRQADRYGGWSGRRFEATGSFRLEYADRWWLVTPDGNAFLSLGLNHTTPSWLLQPYNRAHWMKEFGATGPADQRFIEGFRDRVEQDMKTYGFNTLGCHSPARHYWKRSVWPYVQQFRSVDIDHWRTPSEADFHDVFSPAFEARCEGLARDSKLSELRNDRYLLGYSFTDCPILTELDAAPREKVTYGGPRAGVATWPRVLRNLSAEAPGKKAYVELMRRRYADEIHSFNEAYGLSFASFESLAAARDWRPAAGPRNPAEARDNEAFLRLILDRYYRTMTSVVRRHDPNHLICGDKLNGNTDTPDFAIESAAKHVDLVFYQWYGYYGEQKARLDRWSELTGKPLLNGDAGFSILSENMPNPLGPDCTDQEERAVRTLEFGRRAFARPDFIGWHYCGWLDTWKAMPGKETRQHSGLQDPLGRRYEPMVRAMKSLSEEMYTLE